MVKNYIPLGFQCSVKETLKNMNIYSETLPFDWMLSSPKFVYEILSLLLSDIPIDYLVKEHFFNCTNKSSISKINGVEIVEHYISNPNGNSLYNEKYDVIFPHDVYNIESIEKYIRRFERLYNLIKNGSNLVYVYISPSSNNIGDFTIDGRKILTDVNKYLIKIYELIKKNSNSTFEFKVLSTYDERIDCDGIKYSFINPKPHFIYIIDDCVNELLK